jgi:hypothetical protein
MLERFLLITVAVVVFVLIMVVCVKKCHMDRVEVRDPLSPGSVRGFGGGWSELGVSHVVSSPAQ